jgi:hypothetical protein
MRKIVGTVSVLGGLTAIGLLFSAPAQADENPPDIIEICDETTCTVYEWGDFGCSPLYSYPRRREVSGGGDP